MNMNKKAIAILLCVCLLASMFTAPVFAAGANTDMTVDKTEVEVGDTVTVEITNGLMTVAGYGCYLEFDGDLLECTKITGAYGDEYLGLDKTSGRTTWVANMAGTGEEITAATLELTNNNETFSFGVVPGSDTEFAAGIVATLEFEAKADGVVTLTLTEDSSGADAYKDVVKSEDVTIGSSAPAVVPVTGVSLNKTSATLTAEGATVALSATVAPNDATNKDVTWTSNNKAVATVDENGVVTAVANGRATITVTTVDGAKKATCAVTVNIPPAEVKVTGVTLNKTAVTLTAEGETAALTATVAPVNATNKNVTWSSSNPAVATVDQNGKVTAVANGTATITVTTVDGAKKATCAVTVNIPPATVAVTGVTLDKASATLTAKGETVALTATVAPANATNKDVTWTSSNKAVATVDEDGVVTAVANGRTTITVTTVDGAKKATCAVVVNIPAVKVEVTSVTLDTTAATLAVGENVTLKATVNPDNATDKTVRWSSSNNAVATVSWNGKVVANAAGTATITANAGGKTATCVVTVKPVDVEGVTLNAVTKTLKVGQMTTLKATVLPANATDKTVTWSSSNPAVATVDQNGNVSAKAVGTATITANASGKTASCTVTVEAASVYVPSKSSSSWTKMIIMQIGNKDIEVNWQTITNDVAPVIVDNRTMVPIRVVTELLGGTADWNEDTRTVTLKIDGEVLTMTIDKEIPGFGTSAIIMDSRTYVPIRYVAENLGAEVTWNDITQKVTIIK